MKFLAGSEKQFFEFISELNEKDKVALICHNDLDGISSGLCASKVVGNLEMIKFIDYSENMIVDILDEIKKKKINKIMFFDISFDDNTLGLAELSKLCSILVLDHHRFIKDLNSPRIAYIKTETENCVSYVSYYLFSKIQNIAELEKIVALSVVSEFGENESLDFSEKVMKKYNLDKKLSDKLALFLIYFRDNFNEAFEILNDFDSNTSKIAKYSAIVEKEILRIEKDFEKRKETYSWGYYYKIDSKFEIKSFVSTKLSLKEDKLFVLLFEKNDKVSVSFRCHTRKFNCFELAIKATENIPNSSAGGHIPAAGANINFKDEIQFKENLIKILGR